jgi:hypothetical protein
MTPTVLATLEVAGVPPGQLLDFDVFGNQLVMISYTGALWRIDLSSNKLESRSRALQRLGHLHQQLWCVRL